VSALGPSDGAQVSGFGGGADDGLQPQPTARKPMKATMAISRGCTPQG
jgi:hypothetical protein